MYEERGFVSEEHVEITLVRLHCDKRIDDENAGDII